MKIIVLILLLLPSFAFAQFNVNGSYDSTAVSIYVAPQYSYPSLPIMSHWWDSQLWGGAVGNWTSDQYYEDVQITAVHQRVIAPNGQMADLLTVIRGQNGTSASNKGIGNTDTYSMFLFNAGSLTPTLSFTPTNTLSPTPTGSATPTVTLSPTWTGTPTWTFTPTVTSTPTDYHVWTLQDRWNMTWTAAPTGTITPTNTPTATPTYTQTATPTFTPTQTPTFTTTFTPTQTPTVTMTATITNTPTATYTFTSTYTFTPTFTPIPTSTPQRFYTWSMVVTPADSSGDSAIPVTLPSPCEFHAITCGYQWAAGATITLRSGYLGATGFSTNFLFGANMTANSQQSVQSYPTTIIYCSVVGTVTPTAPAVIYGVSWGQAVSRP